MGDYVICEKEDLVSIASTIRNKTGSTEQMSLSAMQKNVMSVGGGMFIVNLLDWGELEVFTETDKQYTAFAGHCVADKTFVEIEEALNNGLVPVLCYEERTEADESIYLPAYTFKQFYPLITYSSEESSLEENTYYIFELCSYDGYGIWRNNVVFHGNGTITGNMDWTSLEGLAYN